MARIFPRTHHKIPYTRNTTGKTRLPFVRALAIMNLPPDDEGFQFNGGLVAGLTWGESRDDPSFTRHRNALNKFGYSKGILENPTNLNFKGDVVHGKYEGKEPCRWPPSAWVAVVDERLQERCIQLQRKVARHQAEARETGRTFVYFYSTPLDDVVFVELTGLSSHECGFNNVDWAKTTTSLVDVSEEKATKKRKSLPAKIKSIFSRPSRAQIILLVAASFTLGALLNQQEVAEVKEVSVPRPSVFLNSSTPDLYNGDSF